jgi:hypothetical protein
MAAVLRVWPGEETHAVWTGTIKQLIHRYLKDRNKQRTFRRRRSENKVVASYQGRRWCDATERELIGDITNIHASRLTLLSNIEREFP